MSTKKNVSDKSTKEIKGKKYLLDGRINQQANSSNTKGNPKGQKCTSKLHSTLKSNLSQNSMWILLQSLYKQCSLSSYSLQSRKVPGALELLQMGVGTIEFLKAKEKETIEEKNHLIKDQVKMLEKLISLLKDGSSVNSASGGDDDNENNDNSSTSLQDFGQYVEEEPDQLNSPKKFNFRGFRSRKPVYRDCIGRFTAERLFQSSPPPSPTPPPAKDSSAETHHDLSELEFIFKPSKTTFAALKNQLNVRKPLNKEGDTVKSKAGLKNYLNGRQSKVMGVPAQEGLSDRCSQKKVVMKRLMKASKKGRAKRSVNHVWATNLTRKKKRKATHFMKRQQVRREVVGVSEDGRSLFTIDGTLLIPNKQTKRGKQLSFPSIKRLRGKSSHTQSLDGVFPKQSPQLSSRSPKKVSGPVPASPSRKKSKASSVCTQITSPNQTKTKGSSLAKRKAKNSFTRKSQKPKLTRKPHYRVARLHNFPNGIEGGLHPLPTNSVGETVIDAFSTTINPQPQLGGTSNRNSNGKIKHPTFNSSPSENHLKGAEPIQLFYPVHPYTSPDLPVHFIPIDPKNIPDFFPLYYPTIGMKNTTEVYPSFIQLKIADCPSFPRHIFTNALQSSSIPHQTLPAEEVIPRILPGIASGFPCPLVPDVPPHKLPLTGPFTKKSASDNPQTKTRYSQSSSVNGILRTQNNLAMSVQGLPPPSIALIKRPVDTQPKIHKCPKCTFETPKLGVLKRHQLVHSKNDTSSVTGKESQIVDFEVENSIGPNPAIRSSVTINTTAGQIARATHVPSTKLPATDGTNIKIVSAESLKGSFELHNSFCGFSDTSRKSSLEKRLPSVTITPLIQSYD